MIAGVADEIAQALELYRLPACDARERRFHKAPGLAQAAEVEMAPEVITVGIGLMVLEYIIGPKKAPRAVEPTPVATTP